MIFRGGVQFLPQRESASDDLVLADLLDAVSGSSSCPVEELVAPLGVNVERRGGGTVVAGRYFVISASEFVTGEVPAGLAAVILVDDPLAGERTFGVGGIPLYSVAPETSSETEDADSNS